MRKTFLESLIEKAENRGSKLNGQVHWNERTQHNEFSSFNHCNSIGILSVEDSLFHIYTIVFFNVYCPFVLAFNARAQQEKASNAGEYHCDIDHHYGHLLSRWKIDQNFYSINSLSRPRILWYRSIQVDRLGWIIGEVFWRWAFGRRRFVEPLF